MVKHAHARTHRDARTHSRCSHDLSSDMKSDFPFTCSDTPAHQLHATPLHHSKI